MLQKCTKCLKEKDSSEFYSEHKRCKTCKLAYQKYYQQKYKDKIKIYKKEWFSSNKEEVISKQRSYSKIQYKENIEYKLRIILRSRLRMALKNSWKTGSSIKDLGCSIPELRVHLESKFVEGMTWLNYGSREGHWSIDHIKPLSKFDLTDRDQLLEAVNFRNLQPLWHVDNLRKFNSI